MAKSPNELRNFVLGEVQKQKGKIMQVSGKEGVKRLALFLDENLIRENISRQEFANRLETNEVKANALLDGSLEYSEISNELLENAANVVGCSPVVLQILLGQTSSESMLSAGPRPKSRHRITRSYISADVAANTVAPSFRKDRRKAGAAIDTAFTSPCNPEPRPRHISRTQVGYSMARENPYDVSDDDLPSTASQPHRLLTNYQRDFTNVVFYLYELIRSSTEAPPWQNSQQVQNARECLEEITSYSRDCVQPSKLVETLVTKIEDFGVFSTILTKSGLPTGLAGFTPLSELIDHQTSSDNPEYQPSRPLQEIIQVGQIMRQRVVEVSNDSNMVFLSFVRIPPHSRHIDLDDTKPCLTNFEISTEAKLSAELCSTHTSTMTPTPTAAPTVTPTPTPFPTTPEPTAAPTAREDWEEEITRAGITTNALYETSNTLINPIADWLRESLIRHAYASKASLDRLREYRDVHKIEQGRSGLSDYDRESIEHSLIYAGTGWI